MSTQNQIPSSLQKVLAQVSTATGEQLIQLTRNHWVRKMVTNEMEKRMLGWLKEAQSEPTKLPGVEEDRTAMGLAIMSSIERAVANGNLSENYIKSILQLLVKSLFFEQGDKSKVNSFTSEFGLRPPSFLVLSPGKACNLKCTGCYADASDQAKSLEWSICDRMVTEAKSLWGARFFVISGGEPFAYRSEGKGLLELIEKHPDCFFMAFTNSTLITEPIAERLSRDGNLLLCISVEGWRERTDERRGKGVFDKVLESMSLLRKNGVPFGISLTGTRYNAEEILSEEFIDFFMKQGAIFSWLFQYMPIGRAFTLDLMVTPEQRTWMWRRSWEIMREKRFFLADFWNHGTACDGCLSAGGHGNGGYFYVDWNGAVSPCVFVPYSPVNIRDLYAKGKNLNDLWNEPFFNSMRNWQLDYKSENRNGLAPCPNRDHHDELENLLREFEPEPTDQNAAETLTDPEYTNGLKQYNQRFEQLTDNIWKTYYMEWNGRTPGELSRLPEIPNTSKPDIEIEMDEKFAIKS